MVQVSSALLLASSSLLASVLASPLIDVSPSVDLFNRASAISSGCSTTGTASCHNTSAVSNTCCFEASGGLIVQTQFWDFNPSTGPSDSWTIHGLWPDHCDGTYSSTCDSSRAYTNIASLLSAQGASDTLSYMQTYWVDIDGDNESFWEHEWSKHGTCYSTLETKCLPSGSTKGAEAVAYFQATVKLFKTLPTYTWLKNQGITPNSSTKYSLSTLTSALKTASGGYTPALDCTSGSLNAISWYFNLKGSAIDGVYVPISAPSAGSCGSSNILYPPKSGGGSTNPGDGSLPTKATIKALKSGSAVGGLLTAGTWSTQTLATMTLSGTTSSFTMSSSKGSCGVSSGALTCGSGVSSTFSATTSGSSLLLTSGGSTAFTADGTPSGSTVYSVYTGSARSQDFTLQIVST